MKKNENSSSSNSSSIKPKYTGWPLFLEGSFEKILPFFKVLESP